METSQNSGLNRDCKQGEQCRYKDRFSGKIEKNHEEVSQSDPSLLSLQHTLYQQHKNIYLNYNFSEIKTKEQSFLHAAKLVLNNRKTKRCFMFLIIGIGSRGIILKYPMDWRKQLTTKNGQKVLFRPVKSSDTEMLWWMFSTLSEKSLSNLIPPFTREMIEDWTSNIDYNNVLAIVAVTQSNEEEKIIADASLKINPQEILKHKAELAIAVHDYYQNIGIGSALIEHLLKIARKKKLTKVWLNVRSTNEKAMHVYKKAGFEIEAKLCKECCTKGKYEDEYRMAIFL